MLDRLPVYQYETRYLGDWPTMPRCFGLRSILLCLVVSLAVAWTTPCLSAPPRSECPAPPTENQPPDGAESVPVEATLSVRVSDPNGGTVDVSFLGREAPPVDPAFTLVVLPDTQYYSAYYPHIFTQQTQWIVDSKDELNTVFVTHVGDIVEYWDTFEQHWIHANDSMSVLDDVVPYGLAPEITTRTNGQSPFTTTSTFPDPDTRESPGTGAVIATTRTATSCSPPVATTS
jgi:hypothetical protein